MEIRGQIGEGGGECPPDSFLIPAWTDRGKRVRQAGFLFSLYAQPLWQHLQLTLRSADSISSTEEQELQTSITKNWAKWSHFFPSY